MYSARKPSLSSADFKGIYLQHNIRVYVKTEKVVGNNSREVRREKRKLQEVDWIPIIGFQSK
jgi:hypothetical protein